MLRVVLKHSKISIYLTIVSLCDVPIVSSFSELFDGFLFFQISERNSSLLSKNLPSARVSVQLSTNQSFGGAPSVG